MTDSAAKPGPTRAGPPDFSDPEDAKLFVLARSTRARTAADEGAAVRDSDGRTYAASSVRLTSLSLSALQVAVAMAVSSGAPGLEAAVVVGADPGHPDANGARALRELAPNACIFVFDAEGVSLRDDPSWS